MNFKEINILKTICEPLFDYFDYTIKPFDLNYLTIPVGVLISHCVGQLACQSACLVHCLYNFCAIIKGKGLDALLCREITHDCTLLHLVCGDLQSLALFHKINISCQILDTHLSYF